MQTAPGHKAHLWLCSSIFSVVTRQLAIPSLAVLTGVKHKYFLFPMPFFIQRKDFFAFWSHIILCRHFVDSLSPDTTLTHLEKYHSSLSIAHCCSPKVSLVSKVKPLPVSWRAAAVLTCLSLCAALPDCLRGCHLRGTATALSHSYLPHHCHQMFGAAVTVETFSD